MADTAAAAVEDHLLLVLEAGNAASAKVHKGGYIVDQLTKDVLAAEAAGLSYGQYMATKPQPEQAVRYPKKGKAKERRCAVCGMVIPSSSRSSRYCSRACAEKAQTEVKEAPPADAEEMRCGICRKVLTNKRRKYCCPECADEARRLQIAARKMRARKQ